MKELWKKLTSPIIWGNLVAMAVVSILLVVALWVWMGVYTHHGEVVEVPDVKNMQVSDARYALARQDLLAEVLDSSYNRNLPAGMVLDQHPVPGSRVKGGRTIGLVINARQTPTLPVPDIVDNCSRREAEAKLKALGFKLGPVEYCAGDMDWVFGLKSAGRNLNTGDRVPIDVPVVLVVGKDRGFEDIEPDTLDMPDMPALDVEMGIDEEI